MVLNKNKQSYTMPEEFRVDTHYVYIVSNVRKGFIDLEGTEEVEKFEIYFYDEITYTREEYMHLLVKENEKTKNDLKKITVEQVIQDEMIDMSMAATIELYEMLLPPEELPGTPDPVPPGDEIIPPVTLPGEIATDVYNKIKDKLNSLDKSMVLIYVKQIKTGNKTLDDVPNRIKNEVEIVLNKGA